MEDEQIKDIIVALINNKMFPDGKDEEHTAKYVARFIKTLEKELDKYFRWYFHVKKYNK
ncbi:hypothetical protein [Clostridium botulinum]|uniref:hypothetical protein n=1 Tax=Clostridium botulinum TaxID=1491 RepID=UPI001966FAFB|nr:hypothetical protein [Clostridium botulinum]